MRGVVTHHPAQYLRIETYNYTIKQYWVCCLRKKRAGPGCKNGPHPDPFGLGGGVGEQMCGIRTPKKKKLKSVSVSVESVTVVATDGDGDNNMRSNNNDNNDSMNNDRSVNNNNNNDDNGNGNNNRSSNSENIENKNIRIINYNVDINSKYSNNETNNENENENTENITDTTYKNKYDDNTSYNHKIAGDLRLIDEVEEKKKTMKYNIIESETSSSDSSTNIKSDGIPSYSISSYFFKNSYYKNTDIETKKVTYDTKNDLKYYSEKTKKKEISSLPNLENTEINEIRLKKKVGFDYDSERKKEYFM